MRKKILSLMLAGAAMTACCAGLTASAAQLNMDTPSGSAVVRTSCEPSYVVEIPADTLIPFGAIDTQIGAVRALTMKIEVNKAVYVTVDSANGSALVDETGSENAIPYKLTGAESIVFDEVNDATVFPLNVNVAQPDWDAAYAGSYADTLTFTVSYH